MADTFASPSSRPWWTAYFCLMCLVWAVGLVSGDHSPLDLLNSFFFGMGLAGLWGYLSNSRIGWRPFWVGYFCLTIALVIYGIGFLMFDPNVRAWPEIWFFVAAATLVTAPHWVALWRYAFRSSQVWSRGNVA